MNFSRETIKSFLTELCDPTCMNPIVVISDDDIQVQSDLYSIDAGYVNFGRTEDLQEFFLGDLNGYEYDEATEKMIDALILDFYHEISWIEDAVKEYEVA